MTVYVDDAIWDWHGRKWCHLLADEVGELHRFAARLGLHRLSYQGPPKTSAPHYDLTAYERRRAIALGAVACDRAAIVAVARQVRVRKESLPRASTHPLVPGSGLRPARAQAPAGTQGQAARPGSLTLDSRFRGNERNSSRHGLAAQR